MFENLKRKVEMVAIKVLSPLNNRKAIDEPTNSGLKGTVGLVVTLLVVGLVVLIALLVATNGQKAINETRTFFDNLWTTLKGFN